LLAGVVDAADVSQATAGVTVKSMPGLAKVVELASPVADPLGFTVGQADDDCPALCAGERDQWCPEILGDYLH
jgi:hypothetical protein